MEDEYARKFMGGDRVRFLDKVRIPRWMNLLFVGGAGVGAAAMVAAGTPELAPLVALPGALAWGMLSAIRVSVTDTHVHLQYGLFGPKIVLADVVGVEVIDYQWHRFGGWGVRRALNGTWALSIPNRGGKAVRIRYRRGAKQTEIVVTSEQPEALRAAIDEARKRGLDEVRAQLVPGEGALAIESSVEVDEQAVHRA